MRYSFRGGKMYRLSKTILIILITSVAFLFFSDVLKEYNTEAIPNAPICIQVNSDNHRSTKHEIFTMFSKLANEGKYQITLVQLININGKNIKSVHSFNSTYEQPVSYYKKFPINVIGNKGIKLEDVKGSYYTNATEYELLKLQNNMVKLGLSTNIYKVSLFKYLEENILSNNYIPIIVSIFSILLVIMFIEKISQFKKYAILQLNGLTSKQIIIRDIKDNYIWYLIAITSVLIIYLIYLFSVLNIIGMLLTIKYIIYIYLLIAFCFLILDLISYISLVMINIYPAIQGKIYSKPFITVGYLLKICLILVVTINICSLCREINVFNQDQNIMKM